MVQCAQAPSRPGSPAKKNRAATKFHLSKANSVAARSFQAGPLRPLTIAIIRAPHSRGKCRGHRTRPRAACHRQRRSRLFAAQPFRPVLQHRKQARLKAAARGLAHQTPGYVATRFRASLSAFFRRAPRPRGPHMWRTILGLGAKNGRARYRPPRSNHWVV